MIARISSKSWGDRQIILALTLAALFLFCLNLGNVPLRDWDEGTRGLIAREIYRTGNWLHPTEFGEPYLLKPPLMDWLMAVFYRLGGVNEWTSRLPGAIATALGIPLLYCLGKELFQSRPPALYSALIYLTLLPVVRHGRLAMLDGLVMTGMIFSLWCLLRSRHQPMWVIGFGLGLGVIAFVKGLLMLPIAVIALLFIIWDRRWQVFRNIYLWLGLGIGFSPVMFWYGAQIQYYGDQFIQVHFLDQGLNRVADTVESHQQPPWFYLLEIIKYTAPWLFFLPQSYFYSWQQRPTAPHKLILTGSLFYLGLISTMGTKLPWYVMPVYPFIALALGSYFATGWQPQPHQKLRLHWLFYTLAIATLGGTIYFYFSDPQLPLIIMVVVVSIMFALAGWHWRWQHPNFIAILIIGSYCSLSFLFISQSWLWEINEAFPVKPIGEIIRTATPANSEIFTTFSYRRPSLDFYGDRPVRPTPLETLQPGQYWLIDQEIRQFKSEVQQVLMMTARILHSECDSQAIFLVDY
jgi:4-amino-4-deoxy-L-arabinose transferase-like glycosyltransferase